MNTALKALHDPSPQSALQRTEVEFAKDIWDLRCIPGARYSDHYSNYVLNFTSIPVRFRPLVKQYLRFLLTKWGQSHCGQHLSSLCLFLTFFLEHVPDTEHFQHLGVSDMDAYLVYLQATPMRRGKTRNESAVWRNMSALDEFLRYLQRIESPLAPTRSIDQIIWPSHRGKLRHNKAQGIKYIPQFVLEQLDQHLKDIPPRYLPILMVLRASGWRISDVLHLRYDDCLERSERGWYLRGDIQKTKMLGHKVPITSEVASLIQAQCELVRRTLSAQENPSKYLFPAVTAQRAGLPMHGKRLAYALNQLAKKDEIRAEDGTIFHFKTHAFRHAKAVELLNNGMPLVYVQQWLAHLSPEMTLIYAKLLDTSMHRKWEEAMAQGAVRINVESQPYSVGTEILLSENELELAHVKAHLDAIRLANGYCFKHKTFDCPAAKSPCYTCPMFVTTPEFLPQFEQEVRDTEFQIELGEAAGRTHWVEANQQKLTKLIPIRDLLASRQVHQPLGKAKREYTAQEMEAQQEKRKRRTSCERSTPTEHDRIESSCQITCRANTSAG